MGGRQGAFCTRRYSCRSRSRRSIAHTTCVQYTYIRSVLTATTSALATTDTTAVAYTSMQDRVIATRIFNVATRCV